MNVDTELEEQHTCSLNAFSGLSFYICVRYEKKKKPACSAGPLDSNSAVVTSHLLVDERKDVRDETVPTVGSMGNITQ